MIDFDLLANAYMASRIKILNSADITRYLTELVSFWCHFYYKYNRLFKVLYTSDYSFKLLQSGNTIYYTRPQCIIYPHLDTFTGTTDFSLIHTIV